MWDNLLSALEYTGFPFAHYAWADNAPERARDHGVYAEDGERALFANNRRAERVLEGTIDLFTRDDTGAAKRNVEEALDKYDVKFRLESIQYEQDSGFIHYEWVFNVLEAEASWLPLCDPSNVQFEDAAAELLYSRG